MNLPRTGPFPGGAVALGIAAMLAVGIATAAAVHAVTGSDDPTTVVAEGSPNPTVSYVDDSGRRVRRVVNGIHTRIVDFGSLKFATNVNGVAYFTGPAIEAVPDTTCILQVEASAAASACSDNSDVAATGLFIAGDTGGAWYVPEGARVTAQVGRPHETERGVVAWGPEVKGPFVATLRSGGSVTEGATAIDR